jgi:predicted phage gp36 major capsid-like protein
MKTATTGAGRAFAAGVVPVASAEAEVVDTADILRHGFRSRGKFAVASSTVSATEESPP